MLQEQTDFYTSVIRFLKSSLVADKKNCAVSFLCADNRTRQTFIYIFLVSGNKKWLT